MYAPKDWTEWDIMMRECMALVDAMEAASRDAANAIREHAFHVEQFNRDADEWIAKRTAEGKPVAIGMTPSFWTQQAFEDNEDGQGRRATDETVGTR